MSATDRLPKRLVSLGSNETSLPHLVDTETVSGDFEKYAALSYCWGGKAKFSLTSSSLRAWMTEIPSTGLPRTFWDAFHVARSLGISYIWIDALCINQNDDEEKASEIAAMESIYSNAWIVLSATGGTSGDAGFFLNKDLAYTFNEANLGHGGVGEFYMRESIRHHPFGWAASISHNKKADYDSSVVPTFCRAWCFQERLLPTRLLHFTQSEIVFECLCSMNCECGALTNYEGDPSFASRVLLHEVEAETRLVPSNPAESIQGQAQEIALPEDKVRNMVEEWRELVEIYSEKGITSRSDALPALSGLAHKWAKLLGGARLGGPNAYLAGLWRCDLERGLVWKAQVDAVDHKWDHNYIAPTWSWASACGEVEFLIPDKERWDARMKRFGQTDQHASIDLDNTRCIPAGLDEFGAVKTGWLSITGPCLRAKLTDHDAASAVTILSTNTRRWFRPDSVDRVMNLVGSEVWCMAYCTDQGTKWTNFLVFGSARDERKKRLPLEQLNRGRQIPIVERLGLIEHDTFKEWETKEQTEMMELLVI